MKSVFSKCALTAAALALMFGVSHSVAVAEDPAPVEAKGTVTGVVMHEGKVVSGALVRLMEAPAALPGARKKNATAEPAPAPEAPAKGKAKRKVVGEVKTDADGKFSFADIPAGNYIAISEDSVSKGVGRSRITVEAGKSVNVTLDLKARPVAGERPAKGAKKAK